jgi:Flp pilus assembly protein TadD
LIVIAPGRWPAGGRNSELVSLVDVAPTLYAFAGVAAPADVDGAPLEGRGVSGSTPGARWLPLESELGFNSYGWAPLAGITDGGLKWVGAPRAELYDLHADPSESRNLAATRAEDVARLAALYREMASEDRRSGAIDDGDLERSRRMDELRSLGYVSGSRGDSRHQSGLADPKDAIATLAQINEARQLMSEGLNGEAAGLLARVVAVSPRNVSALVLSGSAHILDGSPNQALDPLEAAERIAPQNADVQFNLGLAWLGVNRPDRAEAAWKRALELAPRYEQAAVNVIDLLIKTGRPREAETMMRTVRQTDLESPLLDYLEGKLAILRNDRPAARASLNRALAAGLPEPVAADARALLSAIQ